MSAPVLAVGDGALGFWATVREVFPETREQHCWFHVQAHVLNAFRGRPRRALGAPAHHEPHRVELRHLYLDSRALLDSEAGRVGPVISVLDGQFNRTGAVRNRHLQGPTIDIERDLLVIDFAGRAPTG